MYNTVSCTGTCVLHKCYEKKSNDSCTSFEIEQSIAYIFISKTFLTTHF